MHAMWPNNTSDDNIAFEQYCGFWRFRADHSSTDKQCKNTDRVQHEAMTIMLLFIDLFSCIATSLF